MLIFLAPFKLLLAQFQIRRSKTPCFVTRIAGAHNKIFRPILRLFFLDLASTPSGKVLLERRKPKIKDAES
jgi:hypothetical protein